MNYDNCFYLMLDDGYYIADRSTKTYRRSNSMSGMFFVPEWLNCPQNSYVSTVGSIGVLLFGKPSCLWGYKLKS